MNGKERLYAAIKGDPVDRPPIYLREGFNIGGSILGEPQVELTGYGAEGDMEFMRGWKLTELYKELFDYVSPHADVIRGWDIGQYINRYLMIPPRYIKRKRIKNDSYTIHLQGSIDTSRSQLYFQDEIKEGVNNYWHTRYPVNSIKDLIALAEIPFDFDKANIASYLKSFKEEYGRLGNRGIMCLNFPSPVVTVSHTIDLEKFLIFTLTEKKFMHELAEEITRRCLIIIDAIFEDNNIETIVNLGGSEQCVPPLMSPDAYDEWVVPYEGKIIKRLKKYGILVNVHCHGKVRNALKKMVDMGVDSTDPVEPPPQGDVTINEARKIVGQKLTLNGNLEFNELEFTDTDHIKKRVLEILESGRDRLIVGSSAGPISTVTPRLVENYKAWVDTVVESSA